MADEGLLTGVRVLDLSVWRPGPYATQLLAGIGADVVKIEPPSGDPMRGYPDLFAGLSADKRSIEVDLKSPDGRLRVLGLAVEADVVIEGFRPGVADRLGVGYDDVQAVNPSVVYCSLSGFGRTGPLSDVPGHDLNYMAWAGALAPEGGPPAMPAIPVADLAAGMAAAFGICAALLGRARTGEGERIDLAMADVLATWTGTAAPWAAGADPNQRGVPGYGAFETAGGEFITLGIITEDHFWLALCTVLDLTAIGDLTFIDRSDRREELQSLIATAVGTRPRKTLVEDLLAAGVPVAPVLDRTEMAALQHFRERSIITEDTWSESSTGYPIRFERHPATRTNAPPVLDQHHQDGFAPRP